MAVKGDKALSPAARRLLAEADLAGDGSGTTSKRELRKLANKVATEVKPWDPDAKGRAELAKELLANAPKGGYRLVEADLRRLPPAIRRLAMEIDALWGNADGKVSLEEFERVARFYLAALPFFTKEAGLLIDLAAHLGFDAPVAKRLKKRLLALDPGQVEAAKPFRQLLDDAIAQASVPGAPEMLRDALMHSPRWHRLSVLEHTALAVVAAARLAQVANVDWETLAGTMLLHDVGKIIGRTLRDVAEDGTPIYGYTDHEPIGAAWVADRREDPELVFQIQHHGDLPRLPAPDFIALAGGDLERLARMLIIAIADAVAKGDTPDQLKSFELMRPRIMAVAEAAGLEGEHLLHVADQLRKLAIGQGGLAGKAGPT